jgi:tetratricopeptide (TPR) repeat protein
MRVWFTVPVVLAGVVVGLLTNIVTASPTVPLAIGFVAAVAVLVGLTVWQASRDQRRIMSGLRAARQEVLESIQPSKPDGELTISSLLAAERAVAPFRARSREERELKAWCLDPAAEVVRLLAGPSGVGKSRLAVELAHRLPERWMVGRCVSGRAKQVLAPVLACEDPTLIVVDDADTEPGVASLVSQAREKRNRGQVKVLLIAREAVAFEQWLNQDLPDHERVHLRTIPLAPVGESSDRRRWFSEAAVAYAAALGRTAQVSAVDPRRVGAEGDPMVVTQARAVLAALADSREQADAVRGAGLDAVAAELILHERQRWNRSAEDPRWGLPVTFTAEAREEALLALTLFKPTTAERATAVLRLVPWLRDEPENILHNIVVWAHHLYPGGAPVEVVPSPDFLRAAILAGLTDPAHGEVLKELLRGLPGQHNPSVLDRLVRAAALFPGIAGVVDQIMREQLAQVTVAIEYVVLTGPAARIVEQHLLTAITSQSLSEADINRMLNLVSGTQLYRLQMGLRELAVACARESLSETDIPDNRALLAARLANLGISLRQLGRRQEAFTAFDEAVRLYRMVAEEEPRYTPNLAGALKNLGACLRELGRYREALAAQEEAVGLYRKLAEQEPVRHTPDLAAGLGNLGTSLDDLGRYRDALAAKEEATALYHGLIEQGPAGHTPDLAAALNNLGLSLGELGRHQEALLLKEEAVGLYRGLAEQESARPTDGLAGALNNLGAGLRALGRYQEALIAKEEAVGLYRGIAEQEPARHTPELASGLNTLGTSLRELGRYREALTAKEEAVGLYRELAEQEPARHTPELARALNNFGVSLGDLDRYREALTAKEEAVGLYRGLAEQEPARHTRGLANALSHFGAGLWELGRDREALTVEEEAIGLYRKLTEQEPARHTPELARALDNLGLALCAGGQHEEELGLRAEATAWWRRLWQLVPDGHHEAYQHEQRRLCKIFSEHGRSVDEAWRAEQDATRRLGFVDHPSDLPEETA